MVKKNVGFLLIILLISTLLFGCKSALPDQNQSTLTLSNGTDTIEPFQLFKYSLEYQDSIGEWLAADGEGNFQYDIADYASEFPSLRATDKISINVPANTQCSLVKLMADDFSEIELVNLSKIVELDAGTYILKMDIETIGRTIGSKTESTVTVGFVKIIVRAE